MLVSDLKRIGTRGWKPVAQDTFLSPTSPGPVRRMMFAIDYSNNLSNRHTTFDFDDPTQARSFAYQLPQLGDLWQTCWRTDKQRWKPEATETRFIIPAVAFLPRGVQDSRAMTVNVHLSAEHHQSTEGAISDVSPISRIQVKLLHCK